jgi:hypothetical protein
MLDSTLSDHASVPLLRMAYLQQGINSRESGGGCCDEVCVFEEEV